MRDFEFVNFWLVFDFIDLLFGSLLFTSSWSAFCCIFCSVQSSEFHSLCADLFGVILFSIYIS